MSIWTRASAAGHYENALCDRGAAGMFAVSTHGAARLAAGFARPARGYTLVTLSDGTRQGFFVNGTPIGVVANRELAATAHIGLGLLSLGGHAGAATFSHFTLTPLPASP